MRREVTGLWRVTVHTFGLADVAVLGVRLVTQRGSDARARPVRHEQTRVTMKNPLYCLTRSDRTPRHGGSGHNNDALGHWLGGSGVGAIGRRYGASSHATVRPVIT